MLRILEKKGKWADENFERDLLVEECPNPKCGNGFLRYPKYLVTPFCQKCKSNLPGAESGVRDGHGKRIAYHLGG